MPEHPAAGHTGAGHTAGHTGAGHTGAGHTGAEFRLGFLADACEETA